ncbi:uncharacterized protein LOC113520829 [Galleria mellonella]|uniref:Uncharacterized protein LOC113520829 n=1 Tax=Galleria mellonella TaxID=7137 RepID=A0A6J1X6R9_GALME|nr:uncharacterized protein LOC113520829 [Galleria mellonella]
MFIKMEIKNIKVEDIAFLFDISKEIKHMYETPVIFITKKDYSDILFNAMCTIRSALQTDSKNKIIDVIVDYHLQWLHAVNELENFKKRVYDVSREEIYQAISYTIDAMSYRLKYYQKYMQKNRSMLSNLDQANVIADLEIIEDMHKEVTVHLLEKLRCFRNYISNDEFVLKVNEAVDELLQWLDKINDGVSIQLTAYINMNVPHLTGDLTKTLQQIVEDLHSSDTPSGHKMLEELKNKGKELRTMIRSTAGHSLEISKVVEKINILEERIKRLEGEKTSAAVMALKHKKEYLEKRLDSLENLKTTLKNIHNMVDFKLDVSEEDLCTCEDFYQLRIFNHFLPPEERERLVTELCYLWDLAVFGDCSHKSIISILSAADIKEEYTDDLGTYYIDEHSRKIYKIPDDVTLYQPNEHNELVPLTDDSEHIYFYDECGRYYVDAKSRQRVYKAHATASEFMMDSSGILLKIKEERDGVVYYYDNCGRYYINNEGKHIYREENALSEYESDGLGNLVRIRSHLDIFQPCPDDVHVTEDFKYLKQSVGPALRKCIADVIIYQPADPIKYLSLLLIKFKENIELKEKRSREKEEFNIEREIKSAEERAAAERAAMEAVLLTQGGSETSYDSNFLKYTSMHQDDALSAGVSSKK